MGQNKKMKTKLIKVLFIYVATLVGLLMMIWGSGSLVNLALKTWVFTEADSCFSYMVVPPGKTDAQEVEVKNCEKQRNSNRQSEAANAISQLLVGAPVFWAFYKLAKKEKHEG